MLSRRGCLTWVSPNFLLNRIAGCARLKIAGQSGFADISHFNRSFRRAFGDTPLGVRVRSARRAR